MKNTPQNESSQTISISLRTNMSDQANNSNDNAVNSASFASILAGVQRMRESASGTQSSSTPLNGSSTFAPQSIDKVIPRNDNNNRILSSNPRGSSVRSTSVAQNRSKVPVSESLKSADSARSAPIQRSRTPTRVTGPSEILVHKSQKGNPLLENSVMKTLSWSFDDSILTDYYISPTFQILFLSLKYFKLHPEYIWQRIKKLNKGSVIGSNINSEALRILLVVIDIDSHQDSLCTLSDICLKHDLSLVLAWSFEEAGNYVAFSKQLTNAPSKSREAISGFKGTDFNSCVVDALTGIKSINKTDVSNLLANCKSVCNIVTESCKPDGTSMLENINGLGATKLRNLKSIFSEPFIYNKNYDDKTT